MTPDNSTRFPYITPKGRDLRLDLLRGYFVFAMVVDHVCGMSPLWYVTGGNRFFAGAAEGFVLTAGLVAGLVYARRIKRDGLGPSLMKVLSRVLTLYLVTLALTLTFLPLSELLNLPWAQGLDAGDPLSTVVSILTLHRTYYLVDVMLLYTVLFLLAPLALVLLDQGKRWWVLGLSWLLWGLFQIWPEYLVLPWPIAGNYLFSFAPWQAIFFTGLVFGYEQRGMPTPEPRKARRLLALSGAALLLLVALFVAVRSPNATLQRSGLGALVEELFLDKVHLRPGRILAAGITLSFLFLAVTVFWQPVRRSLGWLLLPLGQHALYAYTVHVWLVALVAMALAPLKLDSPAPQWLNALIQVAAVALIWVLVRFQVLAPTSRTRRLYHAAPVPLAALAACALYFVAVPTYMESEAAAVAEQVNRFGTPLPSVSAAQPVNRFGTPLPPAPAAQPVNRFGTPLPPNSAARPVNRFGTPLPPASDAQPVNRFGTPLPPKEGAAPTLEGEPTSSVTPQPAPTLDMIRSAEAAQGFERVAGWVGQINGRLEEYWFHSDALGREIAYWAYLPPGYDAHGRRYPTVYMLHGTGGHRDEWICFDLVRVADREMSNGALAPMILILPQGDKDFWVNDAEGGQRWGDYLTQDLVAQVDSTFRTLPTAESRAIGGLSMGGFGALVQSFTHPETFGVVGAHTPCLHTESAGLGYLGAGEDYAERDPLTLARTLPGLDGLRIWIDIATEDYWLERAHELHEILAGRGIEHTWNVFPGTHVKDYWVTHVIDYLHFYGGALAPS